MSDLHIDLNLFCVDRGSRRRSKVGFTIFLDSFRLPDRPPAETVAAPAEARTGRWNRRDPSLRQHYPGRRGRSRQNYYSPGCACGNQGAVGKAARSADAARPIPEEKDKVVAALQPGLTSTNSFTRSKVIKARRN